MGGIFIPKITLISEPSTLTGAFFIHKFKKARSDNGREKETS